MIKKFFFALIAGFFCMSCASVNAKQPLVVEQIEGFTPQSASIVQGNENLTAMSLTRQHLGAVYSLAAVPGTNAFFSAGMDGFLSCHNTGGNDETWQISDIPLRKIAVNPDGNLIAVYETDGFSIHRISLWDWKNKKRIYAKRFRDSVVSLSWSAKGKYLMIGNTSIEGITILDGMTGTVQSFFKTSPGLVSLSVTGSSETTMITYGPSGRILYTDISTKTERANYAGQTDLASPVLLNNNVNIAGYRDNTLFVLDATSGKTLTTFSTGKPIMATKETDKEPLWFEENISGEWILRIGASASPVFTTPDNSKITTACSLENLIILGTEKGMVYSIPKTAQYTTPPQLTAVVEDTLRVIDDIASDGSRLFLLSSGSVFISSGPGKSPVFAFDGVQANHLMVNNDALLFWSTKKGIPLTKISFDGETRSVLFQPKEGITSVSASTNKIALIEESSLATVLDLSSAGNTFTYAGAGLQEALIVSGDRLIVSKSATMRSPYPLVLINTHTGETVPLPVTGELCFGFRQSSNAETILNGFIVKAGKSATTELVTVIVNPQTVSLTTVKTDALYGDEDLVATLIEDGDKILTNLGKSSLVEIQKQNGQQLHFNRGYALPLKAALMDQYIVSLNYDGSLSWFNRSSHDLVRTASITGKKVWTEE